MTHNCNTYRITKKTEIVEIIAYPKQHTNEPNKKSKNNSVWQFQKAALLKIFKKKNRNSLTPEQNSSLSENSSMCIRGIAHMFPGSPHGVAALKQYRA